MRIISGKYKGKKLFGFDIDGTRPTMDRVKESMFGIIQNSIDDSVCLDLFAGSGSLGLEALSNGARECYFVENNKEMFRILEKNVNGISNCILVNKDYLYALQEFCRKEIRFDVIFLDPPYKLCLINSVLDFIYDNKLLNENGIIVCEYEIENVKCDYYYELKNRKYGEKKVTIYKNV